MTARGRCRVLRGPDPYQYEHAAGRAVASTSSVAAKVPGKAYRAAKTVRRAPGRVVEMAGSGVEAAGRVGRGAGVAMRASGTALRGVGKGAQVGGKATKVAGKAADQGGTALLQAGSGLSSTGLGALAGVPVAALGGVTKALGLGAQGVGTAAEKVGKVADKAGQKVDAVGKKVGQTAKKVAEKGKHLKQRGQRLQGGKKRNRVGELASAAAAGAGGTAGGAGGSPGQVAAAAGKVAGLAASTAADVAKGPLGWAKLGGRAATGVLRAFGKGAAKAWGGAGAKGGIVKGFAAVASIFVVFIAALGGGSMHGLANAEDGVSEMAGAEFTANARNVEVDVFGDPHIPWELLHAVSFLTTDFGNRGPYPSDVGARIRGDGDSEADGSTFPYVDPPILPSDSDPQGWWWGGHGVFLFNPVWIESLPDWGDVYGAGCVGSPIAQPYSPTGDDLGAPVSVRDIDPDWVNGTEDPDLLTFDDDEEFDVEVDEFGNIIEVHDDHDGSDPEDPDDEGDGPDSEAGEDTTTSSSTTTSTSTTTSIVPVDARDCSRVYEQLGIDPDAGSEEDLEANERFAAFGGDFPVPVVVRFDPQHTEVAQWVLAAVLRAEVAHRFGSDGYLNYAAIPSLQPYYDDHANPTQLPTDEQLADDDWHAPWPAGMYPYEDPSLSLSDDPLSFRELSKYRVGGIGAHVWADVIDSVVHRQYACEADRWTAASPPSPVPPLPDESKVIVVPVPCPPRQYFELEPAVEPGCVAWEAPASNDADDGEGDGDGEPERITDPVAAEEAGLTDDDCVERSEGRPPVLALSPLPPLPPIGAQVIANAQALAEHPLYDPDGMLMGLIGAGEWLIADIPAVAMRAYNNALAMKAQFPETAACDIDVFFLAAIAKQESSHGQFGGATLLDSGESVPPIRGADVGGEQAMGAFQFMPGTWRSYGTDGNGDGSADPDNIFDAAVSAMRKMCSDLPAGKSFQTEDGRRDVAVGYFGGPAAIGKPDSELGPLTRQYPVSIEYWYQTYRSSATLTGGGLGAADCAAVAGPVGIEETALVPGTPAMRVHSCLVDAVARLVAEAKTAGLTLSGGGWRDIQSQIALRRQNCRGDVWTAPASSCSPPTAVPGRSRHERGLAIDFSCNGAGITSRSNPCFIWLAANAERFGLRNLPSEPWHWSTDGK